MADLKPIGSEKLTGQEKLNRIMEIARYKEPSYSKNDNLSTTEYSINLSDGNHYQIVKEKAGYIIKKTISESAADYIEPMKNRKYYPSYSGALKRLNLMAKELNRLNENDEGVNLFGEQKKFVLKTPKPAMDDMEMPAAPPAEPPAVPSPELPPSPMDGGEEMPVDDMPAGDMPADDMGLEDEMGGAESSGEQVTFKSIQKLTGKLTQKIREYESEQGLTSEDIKYVLNMVISSVDLNNLSEEDREDVLSKFESDEDMDMGDENMGMGDEEDITSDSEVEDIQADMDVPVESEMGEYSQIYDSIFGESKVDKVISNYFELTESEKKQKLIQKKKNFEKKVTQVRKLSESIEQELSGVKFLEENRGYSFVGKTNKSNLVFEGKQGQVKISPEGLII
jgi:hypothetical protein